MEKQGPRRLLRAGGGRRHQQDHRQGGEGPPRPHEPGSALTKRLDPKDIGGKSLDQWIKEIKSNLDPSVQQTAMRVVPYFGKKSDAAVPALLYRLRDTGNPTSPAAPTPSWR